MRRREKDFLKENRSEKLSGITVRKFRKPCGD